MTSLTSLSSIVWEFWKHVWAMCMTVHVLMVSVFFVGEIPCALVLLAEPKVDLFGSFFPCRRRAPHRTRWIRHLADSWKLKPSTKATRQLPLMVTHCKYWVLPLIRSGTSGIPWFQLMPTRVYPHCSGIRLSHSVLALKTPRRGHEHNVM